MDDVAGRRRRRTHSAEFKAEAVAACQRPNASIAGCAMERGINANLLRRWVLETERTGRNAVVSPKSLPSSVAPESFLPVVLPGKRTEAGAVRIEVRRGALTVIVQWPASAMHECAGWLREVLK